MDELTGRLAALDAEASESLKVIAYFDRLISGGAGLESVARAAAVLAGVPAGIEAESRQIRVGVDGTRLPPAASPAAIDATFSGGPRVWLERVGPKQANDAMIVERMGLAATTIVLRRSTSVGALEQIVDPATSPLARARAAARLRLGQSVPTVVIALPPGAPDPQRGPSAIMTTSAGPARIVIDRDGRPAASGPAGSAHAVDLSALPAAWRDAQIALAQTDARHPVITAESLGVLIEVVRRFDPHQPVHPDVAALLSLENRDLELLDLMQESASIRAAARSAGLHHSSLQARLEVLRSRLGYDPISPTQRGRYTGARLVSRMVRPAIGR